MAKILKLALLLSVMITPASAQFVAGTLAAQHHASGGPTWSNVQNPAAVVCAPSVTSCAVTVSTIGAGHLLVVKVWTSTSTVLVTSITCGSCGAWVQGPNATASAAGDNEIWYILSSSTGGTTVTVNIGPGTANESVKFEEWATSSGTIALDSGATPSNQSTGTNTVNPTGPVLTVGSNNKVVEQQITPQNNVTACNAGYTCTFPSGNGEGFLANTTTAPTITWTSTGSGNYAATAIAFQAH